MSTLKTFRDFEHWVRPIPSERAFHSPALDEYLENTSQKINHPKLRRLFINTFANTADTTAYNHPREGKSHSYIITGDIEAMWLRDSTAQVWHYLPLAKSAPDIENLFIGLIANHARCILLDPYANAFYDEEKLGVHALDLTQMLPGVHERKWEVDSLIYPIALAIGFWKTTNNSAPFDAQWQAAICLILTTFQVQQRIDGHGPYFFDRDTTNPIDTLCNKGQGPAYKATGMIASSFRASDDACIYPFNIPENLFALATLRDLVELLQVLSLFDLLETTQLLIQDISRGIEAYGRVQHPRLGEIYAYEVDGLGNNICMDDANVPSLLSLPFLGITERNNEIYLATRSFILSHENPTYFAGALGAGIGSPHTGKGKIWPISLIIQASTSNDDAEIVNCLRLLMNSDAGTGLLHESFSVDDVEDYTRAWFAWCNSLFAGLIVGLLDEKPGLLDTL